MNLQKLLAAAVLFIGAAIAHAGDLDFIQNKNQFPQQVRFKADLPGGAVFLTDHGFTYNYYKQSDLSRIHDLMHERKTVWDEPVHFHAYEVRFANANAHTTFSTEGLRPYYNNYFLGNDKDQWAGHVPLYQKVIQHNVYDHIDAVTYSKGTALEYDFVVQPGGDASKILLEYNGVTPQLQNDGSLLIRTSVSDISEQAPYAYQIIDGKTVPVICHFKVAGSKVAFDFPQGYNTAQPLVIDPILIFSTFSGGTMTTYGFSATYDLNGDLYAGGECFNVGWPVTVGAYQGTFGGSEDAGINKYNSTGSTRLYSSYFGGNNSDLPNNMMVNAHSELVMCGSTHSTNLPTTTGCFDNTLNGQSDIYIARFSADGSQLKAATYLGGSGDDGNNTYTLSPNYGDENRGEVFTAANGNIYIANSSSSTNFPVSANAYQPVYAGNQDAVVSELDSNLSTLIYSTFLGGTAEDAAFSLVLNSNNDIVICGGTNSSNFPTVSGAYKAVAPGGTDAFVSILSPSAGLVHSTFLGTTSYDHAFKVQKDDADNIYILGQTDYASNYPITAGTYSIAGGNIFLSKLNPTLTTLLASTRMGNTATIVGLQMFVPSAFMHDVCGNTYFSGFFASDTNPLSANAYQTTPGSFWLGALGPDFTTLLYGTYFGPNGTHVDGGTSRFDPAGIIYHSACTADGSFPTTSGAVSPVKLSPDWDIASYKFDMQMGAVTANFDLANNAPDTGCADYHVYFNNESTGATGYSWNFGDGGTSTAANPDHTFGEGSHTITLIATRTTGCVLADTASMTIFVKPSFKPLLHLHDTFICDPALLTLNANVSNPNSAFHYHWEPVAAISSNPNQEQIIANAALSTIFTVHVSNTATGECVDSATGAINITLNDYSSMKAIPVDTSICPGDTVTIHAYGGSHVIWSPDEKVADAHQPVTLAWPGKDMIYTANITNDSGCSIDRDIHIRMLPPLLVDAGPDRDIKRGESAQLNASVAGSYYWNPAFNGLHPVVTPDQTTTYYLYSNNIEGCNAMDSVTIHVTNAMLPNAFSPNGDGINDLFKLAIQDERVHLKDFSVYNRFGQRVFFTKIITDGWDGTYNGRIADLGTYFYYVNYIIGEKTYNLKGDVTLLR